MPIRYDHTPAAVTAWCDCGWREIALTREGAWHAAADHEQRVHPHRTQVRSAATRRRNRSAPPEYGTDTEPGEAL